MYINFHHRGLKSNALCDVSFKAFDSIETFI